MPNVQTVSHGGGDAQFAAGILGGFQRETQRRQTNKFEQHKLELMEQKAELEKRRLEMAAMKSLIETAIKLEAEVDGAGIKLINSNPEAVKFLGGKLTSLGQNDEFKYLTPGGGVIVAIDKRTGKMEITQTALPKEPKALSFAESTQQNLTEGILGQQEEEAQMSFGPGLRGEAQLEARRQFTEAGRPPVAAPRPVVQPPGAAVVDPVTGRQIAEPTPFRPPAQKAAQNWELSDGTTVISDDGGVTYRGPNNTTIPMPTDAEKTTATRTGEDRRIREAKRQALKARGETPAPPAATGRISPEEAAVKGTGPGAKFAAGIDALIGGFTGEMFGERGIFPQTQRSRQILRVIKQLGKAALINSPRFPVAEQKVVDRLFPDPDKFFTNPQTEVGKLEVLRNTLLEQRDFNLKAIDLALSEEEITKLRETIAKMERVLELLGAGTGAAAPQGGQAPGGRFIIRKVE